MRSGAVSLPLVCYPFRYACSALPVPNASASAVYTGLKYLTGVRRLAAEEDETLAKPVGE
jgi:hypothetical protein